MIDGAVGNPPEAYLKLIKPLIDVARSLLEKGETLTSIAFVGNLGTGKTMQILLDSESDDNKDRSAMAVRMAAETLAADFVFVITEVWGLPKDKMPRMDAIIDKYGSIAACPYRLDMASFMLETRYGVWVAQCEIRLKGLSKKKRTISEPEFTFFKEVEGRFSRFLPQQSSADGPVILH